jgi:hypothetical protein
MCVCVKLTTVLYIYIYMMNWLKYVYTYIYLHRFKTEGHIRSNNVNKSLYQVLKALMSLLQWSEGGCVRYGFLMAMSMIITVFLNVTSLNWTPCRWRLPTRPKIVTCLQTTRHDTLADKSLPS